MIKEAYKKHLLTIDISARSRQVITTNTTFWSMDYETGKLRINFVSNAQPLNLTGATVLLGFYFENGDSKLVDSKDGSVVIEDIQQGRCHVIMPSYKFDYSGPVLIYVYILYETGKKLDCATIATEFERSWIDQELPEMEKYYVKRIEDWLAEIETETNKIKEELEARLADLRQAITTAQTQANNIQAQISANNIVTQDQFDNFRVGGRNFILDSNFDEFTTQWIISAGNYRWGISNEKFQGNSVMTCDRVNDTMTSTMDAMQNFQIDKIELNTPYTISFYLNVETGVPNNFVWYFVGFLGTSPDNNWRPTASTTDGWIKVSRTLIFSERTTAAQIRMHFRCMPGAKVSISQLKFEKGNRATDWSPAPEDMSSKFEVNQGLNMRLPLTGGTLTGSLEVDGNMTVTGVDGRGIGALNPRNPNGSIWVGWGANVPRIRLMGSGEGVAPSIPFQIQSAGDFVRFSATNTHAEVPGTFRAGGAITAPSFIGALTGNAVTASRLQAARNFQITGAIEGVTSSNLSNNVVINTVPKRVQVADWNNVNFFIELTRNYTSVDVYSVVGVANSPFTSPYVQGLYFETDSNGGLLMVYPCSGNYEDLAWAMRRINARAWAGPWRYINTTATAPTMSATRSSDEIKTLRNELQECKQELAELRELIEGSKVW